MAAAIWEPVPSQTSNKFGVLGSLDRISRAFFVQSPGNLPATFLLWLKVRNDEQATCDGEEILHQRDGEIRKMRSLNQSSSSVVPSERSYHRARQAEQRRRKDILSGADC